MKIGIIGCYPLNSKCIKGGIEASVYGLVKELSIKHEVVVFDMPRIGGSSEIFYDGNVRVYRYSNDSKRQNLNVRKIKLMLSNIINENIDVCHLHSTSLLSYILYLSLKKQQIHTIVTVHGLAHIEKKKALQQHFTIKRLFQYWYQSIVEYRFLSKCNVVIVDTQYVKDEIENYYNEVKIKHLPIIEVIPQGIDETYYTIKNSANSNVILSVGAISQRKGHLFLLQAFDSLSQILPNFELHIVGTKSDVVYYNLVIDYIDKSPNRKNIHVYTDLSQENLLQEYKNAKVFALHSQEESQGIALVEAMATGLPIVSTRVGGIPFVVLDGETGFLSEYSDIKSFAESLNKLLTNNSIYKVMSQNATKVANNYKWSVITENIYELYKSINK